MAKNTRVSKEFRPLSIYLLLMGMLFYTQSAGAQNVSPNVTQAYGFQFAGNGVYVDMSIGELAISTINTSSYIITQGYLQPISIEQPCSNPELVYYPNPVVEKLTFEALECDVKVIYVDVFDTYGKKVLVAKAENNEVDLTQIGIGIYLLKVFVENGLPIENVKIIKTTR